MRMLPISGLALVALLALALPGAARAEDRYSDYDRGVTIDRDGVHFHFGSGAHYRHVEWPHAREFFASNRHYRKAHRYEHERHRWLRRARHQRAQGDYWRASRSFARAERAAYRRHRHLRKLERDRRHFERDHRSRRGRGRR